MSRMIAGLSMLAVACAGSTAKPPAPPIRAAAPLAAPPAAAPPAAVAAAPAPAQRFAAADLDYRFDDPDRRAKLVAAVSQIDRAVAEEMASQQLPGLALGVVIDGELAYAKGYGVADVDAKTTPDLDTAYRIGSLTKSFTGLGVLALRDDGVLTLDDPLVRWVPEAAGVVYPARDAPPITLRQLLTHTAGLPRDYDRSKVGTAAELFGQLDGLVLDNPPGQVFAYSNLGYVLLGATIARASHAPVREFIAKRIFQPLEMSASAFDSTPALAPAYQADNHTRAPKLSEYGVAIGGGGIVSTVRDLARYVALQLAAYPPRSGADHGPIRRATIREAHATGFASSAWVSRRDAAPGQPSLELDASSYGFGWMAHRTCDADDLVEHNGAIDSYRSSIAMLVRHGVGVIALSNFGNADPSRVTSRVLGALRATGALKPYVAHPALAPGFDAAMQRFLVAYNAPGEANLRDMLAREPVPGELDELAGYARLHGRCAGFAVSRATSPTDATFAINCERGRFEVQASFARGKLVGFAGTSRDEVVPPVVTRLAGDAVSLINGWNDGLFARTFADAKARGPLRTAGARLHGRLGTCRVAELVREVQAWGVDASCERGTAHFYLEAQNSKLTSFQLTRLDSASPCAAQ